MCHLGKTVRRAGRLTMVLFQAMGFAMAGPAGAQDIAIEHEVFWPNEPIEIHYEFSISAGTRLIAARAWDGRYSSDRLQERLPALPDAPDPFRSGTILIDSANGGAYGTNLAQHDTLLGLSVQLFQAAPGRPVDLPTVERSVAILNPVQEAPGALMLSQRVVLPEQSVELLVAVPQPRLDRFEPSSGTVVLYLPAAPLPNGTLLLPEVTLVGRYDGAGEHSLRFTAPSGPGTYELQLRNADGFILDRVALVVQSLVPLVGLGPEPQEAKVGDRIEMRVERPAFPSPWLQLSLTDLVAAPGGGWVASQTFPTPGGFVASGTDSLFLRPKEPGLHRLVGHWQLYHQTHHLGDILAGQIDYDAAAPPSAVDDRPRLSLPKGESQQLGGVIEVGVLGNTSTEDGVLLLRLLADSPDPPAPRLGEWEIDALPALIELPEATPPGFYLLVLYGSPAGEVGELNEVDRASLTLFPPREAIELKVNSGRPVAADLPFAVTVALPEPFRLDDPRFELNLVHLGGDIEGCRTLLEKSVAKLALGGDAQIDFGGIPDAPFLPVPGRYEARLQWSSAAVVGLALPPLPGPEWGGSLVLASVPFTVAYQETPGALALVQVAPDDTEDVVIAVRVPPAYEAAADRGLLWLEVERQAERSHFGVERLSQPTVPRAKIPLPAAADPGGQDVLLSLRPGPYDIRLVQEGFCFLGSCRRVLLDRMLFEVDDEAYEGPLYTDLARDELAQLGPVFPAIGLPGSCGDPDWLPPPEGIVDLRLVRRIEDAFVRVDAALPYGDGFYIEAQLDSPARREIYGATVDLGEVGGRRNVALAPDPENPRLLRSQRLYLLWPEEDR